MSEGRDVCMSVSCPGGVWLSIIFLSISIQLSIIFHIMDSCLNDVFMSLMHERMSFLRMLNVAFSMTK